MKLLDHYIQPMDEIMKYRGQIYKKHTCVFVKEIEQLQLTLTTAPVDPADINSITLEWWKLTIKKHDE